MKYSTKIELSPFTIEVSGETLDVPTYAVDESENPDLLAMEDGSNAEIDGCFVQRWRYRWFVFDGEKWFSLRPIK